MGGKHFKDDEGVESFVPKSSLTRTVPFYNSGMKNYKFDGKNVSRRRGYVKKEERIFDSLIVVKINVEKKIPVLPTYLISTLHESSISNVENNANNFYSARCFSKL